jgi:hypothetical protein
LTAAGLSQLLFRRIGSPKISHHCRLPALRMRASCLRCVMGIWCSLKTRPVVWLLTSRKSEPFRSDEARHVLGTIPRCASPRSFTKTSLSRYFCFLPTSSPHSFALTDTSSNHRTTSRTIRQTYTCDRAVYHFDPPRQVYLQSGSVSKPLHHFRPQDWAQAGRKRWRLQELKSQEIACSGKCSGVRRHKKKHRKSAISS